MKTSNLCVAVVALIFALGMLSCAQPAEKVDLDNFKLEEVTADDLLDWSFYGLGSGSKSGSAQFCIAESDSTVGAMIVSPKSYNGDVVVRYKTMALTSATVLVAMLSASDLGTGSDLSIPADYNGRMSLWTKEKDNYFFAFKNGAHNYPPFIRKYPVPGNDALAIAAENFMLPGMHYQIEIGRIGNRLWLSVDGAKVVEAVDDELIPGGHIALRVRGTAGFKAACLIKDVEIYSQQ